MCERERERECVCVCLSDGGGEMFYGVRTYIVSLERDIRDICKTFVKRYIHKLFMECRIYIVSLERDIERDRKRYS